MASDSSKKKKRREKANSSVDKSNNGTICAKKVMDVEKMPKEELRRYMFPCVPMEPYVEEVFTQLLGCSSIYDSTPERFHVTRVSNQLRDSISKECHSRSGKYQSKYDVEIGKPLDVKSLLFPSRKGHLVRRKLQKRLNAKNLNLSGKYVMLCCFMVPLDWKDPVAQTVAVACHDLYSKMKNQFEMVIVAIMRDGWTDDKKAFSQFMSAFPSSCLAIPFHAKSHRRYVCKHLGGMIMCKITLVAPDGNVLLHDEVQWPWDLEFVPWYHLANSHPFPFVTDPDAGSHLTVPSSLEDLLYCRTTTSDFVFRKKKKKNTESFEKEKLPVSQLKSKLVGLYIYRDGDMLPWFRKIEDACSQSDKELEIVVVFPPRCWWYPEYFSTVLAKQNLSWWVAPYNNTTSIILEHLFEGEKVIIVGPNGSYIDSYGAELMQLYGISAYPFTVNHVLQKTVAELRKVTLESFFEFLNMPFEHHLHHIGKKNILFYFDHPCFIDSVVYDAYTRFTSDTNALILPCSRATELTDPNRDYPEQVGGGKLSWHSACVAGNNVLDKFFIRFFNFEFSTIVAFGKDGLICSVLAHRLPYSRGDKSFSVKVIGGNRQRLQLVLRFIIKEITKMPAIQALVNDFVNKLRKRKIEGSQATARHTAELLRSVISQHRIPYTNQAGALINAVKAVGEQLIAANPVELAVGNIIRRVLHIIRE